jgi:alpha-methylacyl-CoA racemase
VSASGAGPLVGLRVIELSAIGPVPHAAMILADLGADVVRIERPPGRQLAVVNSDWPDPLLRGRRRVALDLKIPSQRAALIDLTEHADVFLEGLRPGVAERLGVGPTDVAARNRRVVYGRMTGWGQRGPLAERAGHDINYISLAGVLDLIGRPGERPVPPLNLVGDYGGGSMSLLVGVLAALQERHRSGEGQVIDASIVDGAAGLAQIIWSMRAAGAWSAGRGANLLDGGAPFYDTYACSDGRFVAVGALEPQFYRHLIDGLGLVGEDLADREDPRQWPQLSRQLADVFARRSRDEWAQIFCETDACVTPVLTFEEAMTHPHLADRQTFVTVDGVPQAATFPRFSRSSPAPAAQPNIELAELSEVTESWMGPAATGSSKTSSSKNEQF